MKVQSFSPLLFEYPHILGEVIHCITDLQFENRNTFKRDFLKIFVRKEDKRFTGHFEVWC